MNFNRVQNGPCSSYMDCSSDLRVSSHENQIMKYDAESKSISIIKYNDQKHSRAQSMIFNLVDPVVSEQPANRCNWRVAHSIGCCVALHVASADAERAVGVRIEIFRAVGPLEFKQLCQKLIALTEESLKGQQHSGGAQLYMNFPGAPQLEIMNSI